MLGWPPGALCLSSGSVKDLQSVLGKTPLIYFTSLLPICKTGMIILCHLYVGHLNVKFSNEKFKVVVYCAIFPLSSVEMLLFTPANIYLCIYTISNLNYSVK